MGVTGRSNGKRAVQHSELKSQSTAGEQRHLDKVELDRTAALIAACEEPFPTSESREVQDYLAETVRESLRRELMSFISLQIAIAIHRGNGSAQRRSQEL